MTCSRGSTKLLLTLALLPLAGCTVNSGGEEEATHVDRVYSGYVIDEDGKALSGVAVASDDGKLTTTTDSYGQFVLLQPTDDGQTRLTLNFNKDGYYSNTAAIPLADDTSHYSTLVTLNGVDAYQSFNADAGGIAEFPGVAGKLLLTFAAASWQDEAGNPVSGDIELAAELIEPESLRADRLPVPSMLADEDSAPNQDVLISSFGMFLMSASQNGAPVYPAEGSTFSAEITGIERFVNAGQILSDSYIPLWIMGEDEYKWSYGGWWSVVPSADQGSTKTSTRGDNDDPVGSDNTNYSIVTDVPVGTATGKSPPATPRYNCDARPILSCVRGKVQAEGLHQDEDSEVKDPLSKSPVSGAWVGFSGTGNAEFCSKCECHEQQVQVTCSEVTNEDGSTSEVCKEELVDVTTYPQPDNSGVDDNACTSLDPNKNCTCSKWEVQSVNYQGSAYTNSNGEYCANVGSGGILNSATVLKDWMITETDPRTKQKTSYVINYEYSEDPQIRGPARTVCEDGVSCATWNHTIPCEWFWQNGGCAVVGGCEVYHLRGYDEEDKD